MQTAQTSPDGRVRCPWCLANADYIAYHDTEWGVPAHDDRRLFEMLILEGAQAGLSWITILKRRQAYRAAYADWNPGSVARFDARDRERLLSPQSGIVRNRLKVEASIENARRFLEVQSEFNRFDAYIWRFTEGRTIRATPPPRGMADVPAETPESAAMSRDLRRRGFRFVGPVICYAFMQACGMVNDHLEGCYRLEEPRRHSRAAS